MTAPQVEPQAPEVEEEFVEDLLDGEEESGEGDEGSIAQPPASGTEPAAPAALAPKPETTAQPRAPDGKFAPKGEPAPSGLASEPAPAGESPKPTTEGAAVSATPFRFPADGKEYTVAGAVVQKDGSLLVPKERVAEVAEFLGQGVAHRGSFRQKLAEADQRVAAAEQKAAYEATLGRNLSDRITSLVEDHIAGKVVRDGRTALEDFLTDTVNNWASLRVEAERAAVQKERETFQQGRDGERRETESRQLDAALETHVGQIASRYPGVDAKAVLQTLRAHGPTAFFFRADADNPDAGLRKGDIGVRLGLIEEQFRLADTVARSTREALEAAAKLEAKNRGAVAVTPAPPAVSAAGSAPAPGKKDEIPTFKSREERDAWLADRQRKHAKGE